MPFTTTQSVSYDADINAFSVIINPGCFIADIDSTHLYFQLISVFTRLPCGLRTTCAPSWLAQRTMVVPKGGQLLFAFAILPPEPFFTLLTTSDRNKSVSSMNCLLDLFSKMKMDSAHVCPGTAPECPSQQRKVFRTTLTSTLFL